MSGVIPPIFASSIILFPASLVQFFGNGGASGATGVLQKIANALSPGQPLYTLLYGFLIRSEEHTSELQSLMRISYAVFCLKKKTLQTTAISAYLPHHLL